MPTSYDDCVFAAKYTLREGGGTFNRPHLDPVTPLLGYAVGLVEGTWRTCYEIEEEIAAALVSCVIEFPDVPYIGTWVDGDAMVHIDPVVILFTLTDAIILGKALGQKAIWDFERKREYVL